MGVFFSFFLCFGLRLFGYEIVKVDKKAPESEARGNDRAGQNDIFHSIFGPSNANYANIPVNKRTVLGIPSVWRAVSTVSRLMASMPFALYRKTESGSELAKDHPNYFVTKTMPSPWMTAFRFREAFFANACLGDAFAVISRNRLGQITQFRIAELVPYVSEDGVLTYIETDTFNNAKSVYLPREVIHLSALTLDGILGEDVISTHKDTFALSIAAKQYETAFFGNGAMLSGVIESSEALPVELVEKVRKSWNAKYAGVKRAGSTAVLDMGMQYKRIGTTPEEAMLPDLQTFQVRESARIFGLPLHYFMDLGDTTFNNIESLSIQFVTQCLRPWAVEYEQEIALKTLTQEELISEDLYYWFNLNGLLRGDTNTRGDFYTKMFNIGAMNPDEVRELENMNKREGGDQFFTPLNMGSNQQNQNTPTP